MLSPVYVDAWPGFEVAGGLLCQVYVNAWSGIECWRLLSQVYVDAWPGSEVAGGGCVKSMLMLGLVLNAVGY